MDYLDKILTKKQYEIYKMKQSGCSSKEMAEAFGISRATVKERLDASEKKVKRYKELVEEGFNEEEAVNRIKFEHRFRIESQTDSNDGARTDYFIKREYDMSLISDEYIDILKKINSGMTFAEIAKEFGQTAMNIQRKAKRAIDILQGKKPSKKICQNCGKILDGDEIGKKYCNDCSNGKIYVKGHEKERHGELIVDRVYLHKGRLYAECKCSCGGKCEPAYNYVKSGRTKTCGHDSIINLAGQTNKYGIKALYQTGETKKNCYVWRCLCTCGKEFDVISNDFYIRKSCGHAQDDARKNNIKSAQKEYDMYSKDGTNAIVLTSKINKNNKSGCKGVYWNSSAKKWQSGIEFRGKRYYLGLYNDLDEAIKSRKIAEEHTHKDFLKWFSEERTTLYEKINDRLEKDKEEYEKQTSKPRSIKKRELILKYNGQEKALTDWCDELGLDRDCVRQRIQRLGWSVEKAFETPVRKRSNETD